MSERVYFTADGKLVMPAALASEYFPASVFVGERNGEILWLYPLKSLVSGGLILKQRNPVGDRSVIIWEVVGRDVEEGWRPATWVAARGGLRVVLDRIIDETEEAIAAGASIELENGRFVVYLTVLDWDHDAKREVQHRKRISDYPTQREAELAARWFERGANKEHPFAGRGM
jgi:hypothetical protein